MITVKDSNGNIFTRNSSFFKQAPPNLPSTSIDMPYEPTITTSQPLDNSNNKTTTQLDIHLQNTNINNSDNGNVCNNIERPSTESQHQSRPQRTRRMPIKYNDYIVYK